MSPPRSLQQLPLTRLRIRDERAFGQVPLYATLKKRLIADDYRFRVPAVGEPTPSWARVLFLNLTYWNAAEAGDVLPDASIDADIVAHAAWHHVVRQALGGADRPSAEALLFGEAVASAFDLYLVGILLRRAPRAAFLRTQVPAMARVAEDASLDAAGFAALLDAVADDPARAFEDLRALLYEVTLALVRQDGVDAGEATLAAVEGHRFSALLHHYELTTWVLYARAYAGGAQEADEVVRELHDTMRAAPQSLEWLAARCGVAT